MDQVLQGISGVHCYLDDILITGKTAEEHLKTLEEVLCRLEKYGLRANKEKCKWFQSSVSYLGHVVTKDGLQKSPDKVEAVVKAPRPQDVSSLRSFLGLVNYYNKFLPNLSSVLHPLYQLLEKGKKWSWSSSCENAFQRCKTLLTSDLVLTHYDSSLPVRLACDASQYGIGAVLSQVMPNNSERPIAFASRSLTSAEKSYAQIDKEALGLVWGVKYFNHYLYGRHFQLVTDHKPLTHIFNPDKGIPVTAAARMQRWALFLSGHDYRIVYKNTKEHGNADGLSRLPLSQSTSTKEQDACTIFSLEQVDMLPVTFEEIERETRKDPVLSEVYECARQGWRKDCSENLKEYHVHSSEISVNGYCLMWGIRVIIPRKFQKRVLDELHQGHLGIVKMKSLARSYVWWPGIDKDIEQVVRSCDGCQQVQKTPASAPLHPWEWPATPWERIHIDFAGPYVNYMYLIVVDACSKWPEIFKMKSTTSSDTVSILRTLFARTGVPLQLVSDNGPQFVSEEFSTFMKANGIQHIKSAPYHPATNGLAERMVQTFKYRMKAAEANSTTVQKKLDQFLMAYRNAPHATTNRSPAEMFYGRKLRSRLDLLKPDVKRKVVSSQTDQVKYHRSGRLREFSVGDTVLVRDYRAATKWMRGEITARYGMHYDVQVSPNSCWRRHIEQIISASPDHTASDVETDQGIPVTAAAVPAIEDRPSSSNISERNQPENPIPAEQAQIPSTHNSAPSRTVEPLKTSSEEAHTSNETVIPERRYPLRNRIQRKMFDATKPGN
jgi:hypothetical protein